LPDVESLELRVLALGRRYPRAQAAVLAWAETGPLQATQRPTMG